MAYFRRNEARNQNAEQQVSTAPEEDGLNPVDYPSDPFYGGYDDGLDFNDYDGEEDEELTGEELREYREHQIHTVFGAGNLAGILAGSVLILVLMTLLISLIRFVSNDIRQVLAMLSIKI